jgi:uncharacterized protein YggE
MGRSGNPATDTITVSGEGTATVKPDVARVNFTVTHINASVSQAQEETTKQSNDAIALLKTFSIADKDIRTTAYTVSPHYSSYQPVCMPGAACPMPAQRVTGYDVSQSIEVTMRDLSKVSGVLAGLGTLNVQNISGPNFGLDDPTAGQSAARADAIAKARQQAALLAKQLGVRLVKIINFGESTGGGQYPLMYAMGGAVARESKVEVAPNVPIGENTYTSTVQITYEIR